MIQVRDIVKEIEKAAPRSLQESWDNTGLQVGDPSAPVTGVMISLDVTPALVDEAIEAGCNMVISHHPLIFKGLKSVTGQTEVEKAVIKAIREGVAVYSSHTALDNASAGVSVEMARRLGATVLRPLVSLPGHDDLGTGVVAELSEPLTPGEFVDHVKRAFGARIARTTRPGDELISRIALCGGAGGSFIGDAIAERCQAYVTGDIRYHDFLDYGPSIFLVDIGHYETERPSRDLFAQIVSKAFPALTVLKSENETNPINYI